MYFISICLINKATLNKVDIATASEINRPMKFYNILKFLTYSDKIMAVLTTFQIFSLTSICLAFAIPSPDILFTEEMVKEYKLWLDDCSQFDEMPYFNKTSESYDCYSIISVGPCKPGEWFVLDKNKPEQAICVEQKCAYMPVSDYDYSTGDYIDTQPES